ncbi:TNFAIP3-interacting protein 1-like [Dendronephthya gigantea]|uniref:TNFAIP3-interacting protein 1-like n=1 Tax=Dendronephthya gigantea TaxID=151771 RepID=UPI00106C5A35|nr:TNFAIP3-interacting protein 1-like [Dendronephthya gigantea]
MSNENKNEICKCKEFKEKFDASVKVNERLAKMITDLKQENEELKSSLRNSKSSCTGEHSGTTGDDKGYKERFEALVKINHGWKKDYEELHMRFDMLQGEKRLLEDEEKELKIRINELEKRQGPLESELARLAGALYTQQANGGGLSEEQCEILKSQVIVYKEDFEKEREDREHLNEEKEKFKRKLEDAEEIIRKLTAELDACKDREEARRGGWSENGYLSERAGTSPRHQVQYVYPYNQVDHRWRTEQQRRGILPRNPPPTSFFYGGEVEVDELRA